VAWRRYPKWPFSPPNITLLRNHPIYSKKPFVALVQDELNELNDLNNKHIVLEADRLSQRVGQDLLGLLLKEKGTVPGFEKYSRHMVLRDEHQGLFCWTRP
jgi:excinuclease UvrABC helicase subunit UvrB